MIKNFWNMCFTSILSEPVADLLEKVREADE